MDYSCRIFQKLTSLVERGSASLISAVVVVVVVVVVVPRRLDATRSCKAPP